MSRQISAPRPPFRPSFRPPRRDPPPPRPEPPPPQELSTRLRGPLAGGLYQVIVQFEEPNRYMRITREVDRVDKAGNYGYVATLQLPYGDRMPESLEFLGPNHYLPRIRWLAARLHRRMSLDPSRPSPPFAALPSRQDLPVSVEAFFCDGYKLHILHATRSNDPEADFGYVCGITGNPQARRSYPVFNPAVRRPEAAHHYLHVLGQLLSLPAVYVRSDDIRPAFPEQGLNSWPGRRRNGPVILFVWYNPNWPTRTREDPRLPDYSWDPIRRRPVDNPPWLPSPRAHTLPSLMPELPPSDAPFPTTNPAGEASYPGPSNSSLLDDDNIYDAD